MTETLSANPTSYHTDYHVDEPTVATFKLFWCEVASCSDSSLPSDLHDATQRHATDRRLQKVCAAEILKRSQFRAEIQYIYKGVPG